MNSLSYFTLPGFCSYCECIFVGFVVGPCQVHRPPPPRCLPQPPPSVCTEPAQIRFYCIYLFIYSYLFSISEASYQRPANLRSRVAGEPWVYVCVCACVCTCMSVCVCVSGDWYKIKTQTERKHWNHHFCYRPLYGLQLPLLTNSSRVI